MVIHSFTPDGHLRAIQLSLRIHRRRLHSLRRVVLRGLIIDALLSEPRDVYLPGRPVHTRPAHVVTLIQFLDVKVEDWISLARHAR